ncbi:MAG: UDP-N-acetylglucosamine 2-epimerase, partial [Victivallaceae bacterium]
YGENLVNVLPQKDDIQKAIKTQLAHGRYNSSVLYGAGNAASQIVNKLAEFEFRQQKHLNYIFE